MSSPQEPPRTQTRTETPNQAPPAPAVSVHVAKEFSKVLNENKDMHEQLNKNQSEYKELLAKMKEYEERVKAYDVRDRNVMKENAKRLRPLFDAMKEVMKDDTQKVDDWTRNLENEIEQNDISPNSEFTKRMEMLTASASVLGERSSTLQRLLKREDELVQTLQQAKEEKEKMLSEKDEVLKQKEEMFQDLEKKFKELEERYKESENRLSNTSKEIEKVEGDKKEQQSSSSSGDQMQTDPKYENAIEEHIEAYASGAFGDEGLGRLYANTYGSFDQSWRSMSDNITPDMYTDQLIRNYEIRYTK